jgi:hypothetical protein
MRVQCASLMQDFCAESVCRSDYHAFMAWFGEPAVVSRVEQGASHQSFGRGAWLSSLSRIVHVLDREALRRDRPVTTPDLQPADVSLPRRFDDGLPTDYRSNTLDIGESLKKISDEDRRFDIALVDSWHEYETSWRDLVEGFRLIRQGGTLVVHDCLPPRSEIAVPNYIQGEWCGVSYQAYVDFISERHDLAVYTVDTDYGCGVIRKLADSSPESATVAGAELLEDWRSKRDDPTEAFAFFQAPQAGSAELDHHR